jgi:hypothetical protein
MSYLHCHGPNGDRSGCHWSQDDFWGKDYNPIKCLIDDYEYFMKDPEGITYIDFPTLIDMNDVAHLKFYRDNKGFYCFKKDQFVWEIERQAKNVKNMKVYTYEQWDKVRKDWKCPKCGSKHWDID